MSFLNMEVSVENIETALFKFYNESDGKNEINQWLTVIQASTQAWTFSFQLITESKPLEVQFFGASTLHTKIFRYWHEVPDEKIEGLRDQLLNLIVQFSNGPKLVLSQLCLSLAAMILHCIPDKWEDPIHSIVTAFQNFPLSDPNQAHCILLEQLILITDEYHSFSSRLARFQVGAVYNALQKNVPFILKIVESALIHTSPFLFNQALRCFSRWINFSLPSSDNLDLVMKVVGAIKDLEFFDSAVDAAINVFSLPDNSRYPNWVAKILPSVLQLEPILQKSQMNNDIDTSEALTRVILAAADVNSTVLLTSSLEGGENAAVALKIVNMMLQCSSAPGYFPVDEAYSDLPFVFWYNLQDEILTMNDDSLSKRLVSIYSPIYIDLANILLRKVRYPDENEYNSWSPEEKESFRCYRQDIADTLMYSYGLLSVSLLQSLCQMLELQIDSNDQKPWNDLEAILFMLVAIAEVVDTEENIYLPRLFSKLSQVPCSNFKLVSQAISLIGAFSEWLNCHPETLSSTIPLVLEGLKETELAQSATLALKEVLQENQEHLANYSQMILLSGKLALDKNHMKPKDVERLMSCLGYALSVMPHDSMLEQLGIILSPYIDHLQLYALSEQSVSTKAGIVFNLNLFNSLFTSLNPVISSEDVSHQHPVIVILQKVLPILTVIVNKWIQDVLVIKAVCSMLKKSQRNLSSNFITVSEAVTQLLIFIYTNHPCESALYLAKQMLILFKTDHNFDSQSTALFSVICNVTSKIYQTDIVEHPDLAEAFMSLLSQITRKNNKLILDSNINELLFAGVLSMGVQENTTVKAACSFITELINLPLPEFSVVADLLKTNGHSIFNCIMMAAGGQSPRSVLEHMADVLLALNTRYTEELSLWLKTMVDTKGFPHQNLTQLNKLNFVQKVQRSRRNKGVIQEALSEFTLICRGMINTEYGRQTKLL